ncbi:MAG: DUF2219 family protein [Rhodobacteraceae bacterium]|nr:DUF2219 family protein [Paracoccaceae bacterium]
MLRTAAATLMIATLPIHSPAGAQSTVQSAASGSPRAAAAVDTEASDVPSPFARTARRQALGYGRLTSNDVIGDGQDRWRTGSVTMSRAYGYEWNGVAPGRLFQLIETRAQGQIIAPDNLRGVDPRDRPYAGALSLGVHSHSSHRGLELALGADLVVIGPQTHLDNLQRELHQMLNKPAPSAAVLAQQIPDTIRPTAVAEIGRRYSFGDNVELRPFAEARAGDETLFRVGADFTFGQVTRGELLSRESITGQRYRVIYGSALGYSFTLGGDMAWVADSVYLPEARGYRLTDRRDRVRAGIHWQGRSASAFYGLTYLGPEFTGQTEGQVAGSIRVKLRF